jgi:tetratricopeptide (TPR) repeat protein
MKKPNSSLVLSVFLLLFAVEVFAQDAPSGPPQGGGQQRGGSRPQPSPQPNTRDRRQPMSDGISRPVYLSGSVRLADGSVPPEAVLIERLCNGVVRPEAYTDSNGNFSFQVGGLRGGVFADASVGNDPFSGVLGGDFGTGGGERGGVSARDLTGCEIRGNLAGFQSDSIMLTFRGELDDPEIGTIRLRRMQNVEGFTFSITTAAAPRNARSAYEKGIENARKQKWTDAEKELVKAVQAYPKYAIAWYELGRVYQQLQKFEDAARALNESINSDSKFISPYGQLAFLAAVQRKWEDVVIHTGEVFKLNPLGSADIFFYSAVANYNLQKMEIAREHAGEAARMDSQHRNPRINHLLGLILIQMREYKEAADNLQTYLKFSPNAPDADAVKQTLAEIEKALGSPAAGQ